MSACTPPLVVVRRCLDYKSISTPVFEALDRLDLARGLRGQRVLLKVNLMRGATPDQARTTHPELARAVVRWLMDHGARPVIAESSGVLGFTNEVAEASGMLAMTRAEGVPFVNLDAGPFRRLDAGGRVLRDILLPELAFECDLRISLARLKTHTLTGLTGALKNLVGLLPGATKCAMHVAARDLRGLAQAVVDIAMVLPFDAGLVDAVWGLEGGGSGSGRPVFAGFIAAGRDLVALDASCAALVGHRPEDLPILRAAAERGLGEARLERVLLDGIQDHRPLAHFRPSGWDPKTLAPLGRAVYALRARALTPRVDPQRCVRCGACAMACPLGCVRLDPLPVIGDACVRCFACREACPHGAMVLDVPRWLLPTLRARTRGLPLAHLGPAKNNH